MIPTRWLLTAENYKHGFLIDNDAIGGVTEMADGVYSAYVSHYATGETLEYREFSALDPALQFLAQVDRPWSYEAVGCGKPAAGSCGGCGCAAKA